MSAPRLSAHSAPIPQYTISTTCSLKSFSVRPSAKVAP